MTALALLITASGESPPQALVPPTGITQVTPDPLTLVNTSLAQSAITDLLLVGGNASGTWAIDTAVSWAKVELSSNSGRQITLRTSVALAGVSDNNDKTVVIRYSGVTDGVPLAMPLSITVTVTVINPLIMPPSDIISMINTPVRVGTLAGVAIASLTIVGGNGDGTWTKPSGSSISALQGTPPVRGRSVVLATGRTIVTGDIAAGGGAGGSYSAVLSYTGDSVDPTVTVTETVTFTVSAAAVVAPSDIQSVITSPVLITAPTGTELASLMVIDGNGNGTWSKLSGNAIGVLSATTGRTIKLQTSRALTAVDIDAGTGPGGAYSATIQYTGDTASPATVLQEIPVYQVKAAAPTDITTVLSTPVPLVGNAAGTEVATLTLIGGNGDGTWTKSAGGSALVRLRGTAPVTGKTVKVELASVPVAGDAGTGKTATFSYTGDSGGSGITLTETVTFAINSNLPTALTTDPATTTDDPLIITNDQNQNFEVGTVSVTGGTGTGAFLLSGTGNAFINLGTDGVGTRSLFLQKDLAPGDNGTYTLTISYSGDGLSTSLTVNFFIKIQAPDTPANVTRVFWRSGACTNDQSGEDDQRNTMNIFGAFRGMPVRASTIFLGSTDITSWTRIFPTNGAAFGCVRASVEDDILPIISLPVNLNGDVVLPLSNPIKASFTKVNNGTYDDDIEDCARRIRAAATVAGEDLPRRVILRPGWEASQGLNPKANPPPDYEGFPWSLRGLGNTFAANQGWRDAFNRVAGLMKPLIPGCGIDFCLQKDYTSGGSGNFDAQFPGVTSMTHSKIEFRGRTFVTHVTLDNYDSSLYASLGPPPIAENYNSWVTKWIRVYNEVLALRLSGVPWQDLKFALDEWGLRNKIRRQNGEDVISGGADNPDFMDHTFRFYRSLSPNIFEWDSYFRFDRRFRANSTPTDATHSLGYIVSPANTFTIRTPWKGKTDNNLTGPGGVFVGNCEATGNDPVSTATLNAPNRYKALYTGARVPGTPNNGDVVNFATLQGPARASTDILVAGTDFTVTATTDNTVTAATANKSFDFNGTNFLPNSAADTRLQPLKVADGSAAGIIFYNGKTTGQQASTVTYATIMNDYDGDAIHPLGQAAAGAFTVEKWTFDNCSTCFRPQNTTVTATSRRPWTVRGCRAINCRAMFIDATEGGQGLIEDCLVECYSFLNYRPTAGDLPGDPNKKTLTIRNCIVKAQPLPYNHAQTPPNPATARLDGMAATDPGHSGFFRLPTTFGAVTVSDCIFYITQYPVDGSNLLDFPHGTYENVRIIWTGPGEYPGYVPPAGVTLSKAVLPYTDARSAWLTAHPGL